MAITEERERTGEETYDKRGKRVGKRARGIMRQTSPISHISSNFDLAREAMESSEAGVLPSVLRSSET